MTIHEQIEQLEKMLFNWLREVEGHKDCDDQQFIKLLDKLELNKFLEYIKKQILYILFVKKLGTLLGISIK